MYKSIAAVGLILVLAVGAVWMLKPGPPQDAVTDLVTGLESLKQEQQVAAAKVAAKNASPAGENPVPSKTGPWPLAFTDELTYSFGRMQVTSEKTHEFVILNKGKADLELRAGTTTCKCTKFGFDPQAKEKNEGKTAVVKPGESVVLYMSWKAGDHPDRGFRHGGDVFTNDPEHEVLKFTVEGTIEMPFEVLPNYWSVGDIYRDQPARFKGAVASRVMESFTIESIKSPSGLVTVEPVPMTPEERAEDGYLCGYALHAVVSDKVPSGIFEEKLEIKVAESESPVTVTVTARKQGNIRIQQMPGTVFDTQKQLLHLGSFAASEGREAKMLMIVDQKGMTEPFQFTKTDNDPSFIEASITPLGEPSGDVHRYVLTFRVPPGRPHAQRTESRPGRIHLMTNHPTGESLNLHLLMYSN